MLKILAFLIFASALPLKAEFAIKDGDTIAFLGDSNTEAGGYIKLVENYIRMRYPKMNVNFINAGIGGDTAYNGSFRLTRDLFPPKDQTKTHDWVNFPYNGPKATVVIVMFGINDINWGNDLSEKTKQTYFDSLSEIVKKSTAEGARVFINSYPVIGEDPNLPVNHELELLGKKAMTLSTNGIGIDVHAETKKVLNNVLEYNKTSEKKLALHIADKVHLTDLGHQAVGFAILKGLGAEKLVSKTFLKLNQSGVETIEVKNGKISKPIYSEKILKFARLDEGLPVSFGLAIHNPGKSVIPLDNEIGQYTLQIQGLPAGNYQISANGILLAKKETGVSAAELEKGINLTELIENPWVPNGPWGAKSLNLSFLTDSRANFRNVNLQSFYYLNKSPHYSKIMETLKNLNEDLTTLQRQIAKPEPIHFEISPLK